MKQGSAMRAVAADGGLGGGRGGAAELLRRSLLAAGLAVLLGGVTSAVRAEPETVSTRLAAPPAAAVPVKAEEPKKEEKPEREFLFTMDGKPWGSVFEWLAE